MIPVARCRPHCPVMRALIRRAEAERAQFIAAIFGKLIRLLMPFWRKASPSGPGEANGSEHEVSGLFAAGRQLAGPDQCAGSDLCWCSAHFRIATPPCPMSEPLRRYFQVVGR